MLYDPKWEAPAEKVKPQLEPWQEVLVKAAQLIQTFGWARGYMHGPKGFCTVGAISCAAEGRNDLTTLAVAKVGQLLNVNDVMGWNDCNPAVNKRLVINVMLGAAKVHALPRLVVDSSSWTGR